MLQCVSRATSHVQMLRGRVRCDLKTVKRHGKSWASGTRIAEAVWPGRYSGVFRVAATMRQVHRIARRTLSSVRASPLDTDNPRWRGSRDSRMQSRNWSDVHIGGEYASDEYASGNERSLVWQEIDIAFENRILTDAAINSNRATAIFRKRWQCSSRASARRCRKTR